MKNPSTARAETTVDEPAEAPGECAGHEPGPEVCDHHERIGRIQLLKCIGSAEYPHDRPPGGQQGPYREADAGGSNDDLSGTRSIIDFSSAHTFGSVLPQDLGRGNLWSHGSSDSCGLQAARADGTVSQVANPHTLLAVTMREHSHELH